MKDDKLRDILSGLIIFVDTNGRGGINVDQAIEAILKDYVHREEVDTAMMIWLKLKMDKAVVLPEKKVYSWGIDQRGMFPSEQYRLEKHGTDNYNQAIDEVARLNKNVVTVEDIEHTILEQYKSDSGFSALAQAIYNLLNGGGK